MSETEEKKADKPRWTLRRTTAWLGAVVILVAALVIVFALPALRPQCPEVREIPIGVLAEKKLPQMRGGIRGAGLYGGGESLVMADSHRLVFMNLKDLGEAETLPVKSEDGRDLSFYWTVTSLVMSPDQQHVMVLDKYIDLEKKRVRTTIDAGAAIKKGKPHPTPLAISADGRQALVWVHSYSSAQYAALGLFDLEGGKLVRALHPGQEVSNARFLPDGRLILFFRHGRIVIESPDGTGAHVLTGNGPVRAVWGRNLAAVLADNGRYLVASGGTVSRGRKVTVFDLVGGKVVFEDECSGNAIVTSDGTYVIYQIMRPSNEWCGCGKHKLPENVLKFRELRSGSLVAEARTPRPYNIILLAPGADRLYGIDHETISRIAIEIKALAAAEALKKIRGEGKSEE
jgi:hypothetical protein